MRDDEAILGEELQITNKQLGKKEKEMQER